MCCLLQFDCQVVNLKKRFGFADNEFDLSLCLGTLTYMDPEARLQCRILICRVRPWFTTYLYTPRLMPRLQSFVGWPKWVALWFSVWGALWIAVVCEEFPEGRWSALARSSEIKGHWGVNAGWNSSMLSSVFILHCLCRTDYIEKWESALQNLVDQKIWSHMGTSEGFDYLPASWLILQLFSHTWMNSI